MIDTDTTNKPVRGSDWNRLLEAILAADSKDELDWVEWKSTLDLSSKEVQAKSLAKHILAFANRDPQEARKHVEGVGLLVVGMEPGQVHGVVGIDNAVLGRWREQIRR